MEKAFLRGFLKFKEIQKDVENLVVAKMSKLMLVGYRPSSTTKICVDGDGVVDTNLNLLTPKKCLFPRLECVSL